LLQVIHRISVVIHNQGKGQQGNDFVTFYPFENRDRRWFVTVL